MNDKLLKRVVTDYRTSKETIKELKNLGYTVILTKPVPSLYDEVQGHADMQVHFVNSKLICEPTVYSYYKERFADMDIVCGSIALKPKYPYDIAYNVCRIGKYAVCRRSHTAPEILSEYQTILETKQGYARCSICIVNSESVITSDEGLYRLLSENKLNVLKIRPGYIELGRMQGFIGGASGLLENSVLAFNGALKTHPDHRNIVDFCRNVSVEPISLNSGNLVDTGTILRIP